MTYTLFCRHPDGCENPIENRDTGLCASHSAMARKQARQGANAALKPLKQPPRGERKAAIAKISKKHLRQLAEYSKERDPWLAGKRCAVYPHLPATDVHHMKGKVGYADKWARENGVRLLNDKRFWLPVSRQGHEEITRRSAWALEKDYSLPRNEEK